MQQIHGAGGGGGQQQSRQPVEAPDTLQSLSTARMLYLIAIGETGGPVNGLRSIYLDGVPIENADGTRNFDRVQAEWRTGTQTQEAFSGFSEVETETAVGVEVKAASGLVRYIDDLNADAVRVTVSVNALMSVDANTNDRNPTAVTMAVDIKPTGGVWAEVNRIVISGKTQSKYPRAVRIRLSGAGPWQLRVRRITPDSTTGNLLNATYWDSYTTIQELQLRYPNYAMLGLTFDAKQFSKLPTVTSDWALAVLQVPSNYDPVTGTYSGAWDGRFKPALSSNPAWWLYTYGTDSRYNINLPADGAWKWDLYRIGQWCDQKVSDGQGGLRRRFEMHNYQTDSADAWKVLQDIASVFCGRVVPYAGGVRVIADMPGDDPAKHFMPANVEEGKFVYSSTELSERYTVASVSFVDPEDGWKRAIEPVEHPDGLVHYGYQPTQIVAMGCKSRAQAQQYGRYVLETAQTETELVSFTAGLYGMDLQQGELFTITDPGTAGRRMGGRLLSVNGRNIKLDAPVKLDAGVSYTLECPLPDGTLERRAVGAMPGERDTVVLAAEFSMQPVEGATWVLIASNLQPTLWRCVGHRERSPGVYEISGIQHNPNKWDAILQGLHIEAPPTSLLPDAQVVPPVNSVELRESLYVTGDQRKQLRLEIDWPAVSYAYLRGYVVAYRQDGGNWHELPEQTANHAEIDGLSVGAWQVQVSSVGVTGLRGIPVLGRIQLNGSTAKPPVPGLSATGAAMAVNLSWSWPVGVPDLVAAELRCSLIADDLNPALLAQLSYPANTFSHQGIGVGVKFWYWLRVQDSWGNWSDSVRTSASSIKDPSKLLEQLQGSITSAALTEEILSPIRQVGQLASKDIPAVRNAVAAAGESALQLLLRADEAKDALRRQGQINNATIDVDATTGLISLKAMANVTTDVDARLNSVQQALNAQAGQISSTTQTVQTHGADIAAAQTSITQMQGRIEQSATQLYVDGKVKLQGDLLSASADSAKTLGEAALRQLLAQDGAGERGRASVAYAAQQIQSQANAAEAEAAARVSLVAAISDTAAAIVDEKSARVAADAALSRQVSSLQTSTGQNTADIRSEVEARTNSVSALSQSMQTLQSTVSGNTAAVSDIGKAVDGVLAEKVIKVNAAGKVAGMGLRSDAAGSAIDFLADRFAISLPDGTGSKQVFTAGKINGQSVVGVVGDLIIDGTLSGRRVLASESVDAGQINTRGLTIKDGQGNVVVDMTGIGSAFIKGQLSAGQVDTRGLTVKDSDGNVILDSGGINGSYIKDLSVNTLKIANGAISWTQVNSYVFGQNGYLTDQIDSAARSGVSFYTPVSASLIMSITVISGTTNNVYLDDVLLMGGLVNILNQSVVISVGPGSHRVYASNNMPNVKISKFVVNILGVMR